MEAKDFWCYFWGTRYCCLVVFTEKALHPQYPYGFSLFSLWWYSTVGLIDSRDSNYRGNP